MLYLPTGKENIQENIQDWLSDVFRNFTNTYSTTVPPKVWMEFKATLIDMKNL